MIKPTERIGLHFFRQALNEMIDRLERRYLDNYREEMSNENVTRFVTDVKPFTLALACDTMVT